jgi:hypothetical protein
VARVRKFERYAFNRGAAGVLKFERYPFNRGAARVLNSERYPFKRSAAGGPQKDSEIHTVNNGDPILGPTDNPGPTPDPTSTIPSPTSAGPDPNSPTSRPKADGLNNSYVLVIHTNGIHHIGMATCSCHGHDKIPLDFVACRLLPASFI